MEPVEPATRPTLGTRGERSARDMLLALAVLLVPIALLLMFYRVVLNGDAPRSIDPGSAIAEAQSAKAFPVAVPADLGDDWHVVSATFQRQAAGVTLRLGYVDPDDNGLQLIESSVPPATLLPAELTTGAKPVDTFRDDARVWRRYDARPGEQALVFSEPNRTLIVVGDAGSRYLETLAAALP
ncbi:MAG TPA: DUF4245 domain-containing protein [Actinoplanes sp.]